MGAGVGAVFTPPPSAPPPPPQLRHPPAGTAAGTPSRLAAQELYWRWFQMADAGGLTCVLAGRRPRKLLACWMLDAAGAATGGTTHTACAHPAADRDGRLVGGDAVQFFERSGLPRELLAKVRRRLCSRQGVPRSRLVIGASTGSTRLATGRAPSRLCAPQVWAASDNRRQGFLDFNAFVRALELVSLAQVGRSLCTGCMLAGGWGGCRPVLSRHLQGRGQQRQQQHKAPALVQQRPAARAVRCKWASAQAAGPQAPASLPGNAN